MLAEVNLNNLTAKLFVGVFWFDSYHFYSSFSMGEKITAACILARGIDKAIKSLLLSLVEIRCTRLNMISYEKKNHIIQILDSCWEGGSSIFLLLFIYALVPRFLD